MKNPREQATIELARDVAMGLGSTPKLLHCRYFYDDEGSKLFEAICELPEYYLFRAEREILQARARELAAALPAELTVFELGSGSAAKTQLVLAALLERGPLTYVPVDISPAALEASCAELARLHPRLKLAPLEGDYELGLRWLQGRAGPKLLLWLGSNIGNLHRPEATAFVRRMAAAMSGEDRLLLGIDLRKAAAVLEPAYDDAAGVTAAFNKNLLKRINRELGGHFELEAFDHRARYNDREGRIDMSLVSRTVQQVRIDALERDFTFDRGEAIHTECCYKYSEPEIHQLAQAAGLQVEQLWQDGARRFSDVLLRLP